MIDTGSDKNVKQIEDSKDLKNVIFNSILTEMELDGEL